MVTTISHGSLKQKKTISGKYKGRFSEDYCSIGILASPRQSNFRYRSPDKGSKKETEIGVGTSIFKRGTYQFTGHTAVFTREKGKPNFARGLVPKRTHVIQAVLQGKAVPGKWQDDMGLLQDPTTAMFEIQVPRRMIKEFHQYFEKNSKYLDKYKLRPLNGYPSNCVCAAINVMINFFYDNMHKFTKEEQDRITEQLAPFIELTAANKNSQQGHLMRNIAKMQNRKDLEINANNLQSDLKLFLKDEIARLGKKSFKNAAEINKHWAYIKLESEVNEIDPNDKNRIGKLMSAAYKIQRVASKSTGTFGRLTGTPPDSKRFWDMLKRSHLLTIDTAILDFPRIIEETVKILDANMKNDPKLKTLKLYLERNLASFWVKLENAHSSPEMDTNHVFQHITATMQSTQNVLNNHNKLLGDKVSVLYNSSCIEALQKRKISQPDHDSNQSHFLPTFHSDRNKENTSKELLKAHHQKTPALSSPDDFNATSKPRKNR